MAITKCLIPRSPVNYLTMAMRALRHCGPQQATDGPRCMTEKIMTHGMELDEVDGDKRNLATTILDDADLEAVSGGASMETTMYVLGINGMYQLSKAAGHRR